MFQAKATDRDQVLYEKSISLRVYSSALLREAQELCQTANRLRKTNASLASDLWLIRAVGFFPETRWRSYLKLHAAARKE